MAWKPKITSLEDLLEIPEQEKFKLDLKWDPKCIWQANKWEGCFRQNNQFNNKKRQIWFEHLWLVKLDKNVLLFIMKVSHSFVSDSLRPMDYTVHGILQARILEWVAFPFSRGSSQARDQTQVSHIAGGFFTSWATREAQEYWSG